MSARCEPIWANQEANGRRQPAGEPTSRL